MMKSSIGASLIPCPRAEPQGGGSDVKPGTVSVRRSRLRHCPVHATGVMDDGVDSAHTDVGDVGGVVVAIRGPKSVEACDRWAFKKKEAPDSDARFTGFHCPCSV